MEWLLLWLALSAISLEGIALFVNEESYHCAFYNAGKELSIRYDIVFGTTISVFLYLLMLILSPIVAYILLSMED